jgi:hypothetical protein
MATLTELLSGRQTGTCRRSGPLAKQHTTALRSFFARTMSSVRSAQQSGPLVLIQNEIMCLSPRARPKTFVLHASYVETVNLSRSPSLLLGP